MGRLPLSLNEQILSTIDMMTAQQIQHVTLPSKALEEMRQMAKDRQKGIPSPRGAAEFNFRDAPKEVACGGSNDDDVEVSVTTFGDIANNYISQMNILTWIITLLFLYT